MGIESWDCPTKETYTCVSLYFPSRHSPPSPSRFLSPRLQTPSTAACRYKSEVIIIAGSTAATAKSSSSNNAVMASKVEATNAAERNTTTKLSSKARQRAGLFFIVYKDGRGAISNAAPVRRKFSPEDKRRFLT